MKVLKIISLSLVSLGCLFQFFIADKGFSWLVFLALILITELMYEDINEIKEDIKKIKKENK